MTILCTSASVPTRVPITEGAMVLLLRLEEALKLRGHDDLGGDIHFTAGHVGRLPARKVEVMRAARMVLGLTFLRELLADHPHPDDQECLHVA